MITIIIVILNTYDVTCVYTLYREVSTNVLTFVLTTPPQNRYSLNMF